MMSDVMLSVGFGFLGYIMRKAGFNPIPLILGLVLGTMVEENFHRALMISGGSYMIFLSSTICKILVVLILLSLFYPFIKVAFKKVVDSL